MSFHSDTVFSIDGSQIHEMELVWFPTSAVETNPKSKLPEMELVRTGRKNCTETYLVGKLMSSQGTSVDPVEFKVKEQV